VKKVISSGSTTVYVYDAFGLASEYVAGSWGKDYIANGGGNLVATENGNRWQHTQIPLFQRNFEQSQTIWRAH
jgi:hypothetical protein